MFAWFRRLLRPEPITRRELMAFKDQLDGLEARIDQHYAELKATRGKVHALTRDKPREDPAGPTNEQPDIPEHLPAVHSTAHLSRRFRSL